MKFLFSFLMMLGLCQALRGADSTGLKRTMVFKVNTFPLYYPSGVYIVGLEKKIAPKKSIDLALGLITREYFVADWNNYSRANSSNSWSNSCQGVYITFGYRWYKHEALSRKWHGPSVKFKYIRFPELQRSYYNNHIDIIDDYYEPAEQKILAHTNGNPNTTERLNKFVLSLDYLYGHESYRTGKLVIDFYTGAGVRFRYYNTYIISKGQFNGKKLVNSRVGYFLPPLPILNLGIKLGYAK